MMLMNFSKFSMIEGNHLQTMIALELEKQEELSNRNGQSNMDDNMPKSDDDVIQSQIIETNTSEDEPEYIPPVKHTELLRKRRNRQA